MIPPAIAYIPAQVTQIQNFVRDNEQEQNLLTPSQTWFSVKLASPARPGIPVGDNVGSFRLNTLKIAQGRNLPGLVIDRMYVLDMLGILRADVQASGKVDPFMLPGLKAEILSNGVKLSWQPVQKSKILRQLRSPIEYKIFRDEFVKEGNAILRVNHTNEDGFVKKGNEIILVGPRNEDEEYGSTFIGKSYTESFIDKSAKRGRMYAYVVLTESLVPNFIDKPGYTPFWDRTQKIIEMPR